MRCLITLLAVLLIFLSPVTVQAQESAGGVINGVVINGTEGGGSTAGVEVTLITYIDGVIAGTRTTITDSEGRFRFDDITVDHQYYVSARYMGVDYYYPVAFNPGETEVDTEVGVCDTTTSDEAVRVGLEHVIISAEEENIVVTEVFWLVNDGDKTYVGLEGVLVFTLPPEATDFQAPQGMMVDYQLLGDNRVTYLVPFPPGERQLVFSYRLAIPDSGEITVPLVIDYPTDSFELMVSGEGIEVAVTHLAPAEPVVTGGGERFIHFQGEFLSRATIINVSLAGLSENGGMFIIVLGGVLSVVLAGIAVYLLKKRSRGRAGG